MKINQLILVMLIHVSITNALQRLSINNQNKKRDIGDDVEMDKKTTSTLSVSASPATTTAAATDVNDKTATHEDHFHWGYKDNGEVLWAEHYEICGGKRQSPIDIVRGEITHLRDFHEIYLNLPEGFLKGAELKNNGHTAVVTFTDRIRLVSNDLENPFTVLGFHFHWGGINGEGSEHRIDGRTFPLEMHIVTYDAQKYGTPEEALRGKNSLAVVGVLFEISESDNKGLSPIIEALENFHDLGKVRIEAMNLTNLLPPHYGTRYYTYKGSLTTPPCSEVVTWIVSEQVLKVSKNQMEKFRELFASDGSKQSTPQEKITFNWRTPQPLNGRKVFATFPMVDPVQEGSQGGNYAQSQKYGSVVSTATFVLVTLKAQYFIMRTQKIF